MAVSLQLGPMTTTSTSMQWVKMAGSTVEWESAQWVSLFLLYYCCHCYCKLWLLLYVLVSTQIQNALWQNYNLAIIRIDVWLNWGSINNNSGKFCKQSKQLRNQEKSLPPPALPLLWFGIAVHWEEIQFQFKSLLYCWPQENYAL